MKKQNFFRVVKEALTKEKKVLFLTLFNSIFKSFSNIISGIVFLILGIEMIMSFKDEEAKNELGGILEIVLFAIAVSIDSFSVGIALALEGENLIISGIVFSQVSALFTFLGLLLGKFLSKKTGKISKTIGIVILFILAIHSFLT